MEARTKLARAARWIAAGGTAGALCGALNGGLEFTSSPVARTWLATLVVLGGAAGSVAGGVAFLAWRAAGGGVRRERPSPPWLRAVARWAWVIVVGAGPVALAAYLGSSPRFAGLLSEAPRTHESESAAPPNVILVSLDTVRPDHLGAYGYRPALTPTIDALAARGALFQRCVATSSWTVPSHASLLTGVAPSHLGPGLVARRRGRIGLPPEAVTLQEVLRASGYHTAAFIGGATLGRWFGFDQGFEVFNDLLPQSLSARSERIFLARPIRRLLGVPSGQFLRFLDPPFVALNNFLYAEAHAPPSDLLVRFMHAANRFDNSAEVVNHKVFRWLDRRPPRPFFLFVHYFDAHDPYEPPAALAPPGYDPALGFIMANGLAERILDRGGTLGASEREQLVGAYDGEIAAIDQSFGKLLERLREEGVLDNAVVAVVSDHGEMFGEHGLVFHGHHLYDTLTRSVLILSGRGVPAGRVAREAVSGIDVVPTILDLVGAVPPETIEGRSLRPLLEGKVLEPRPLFAEVFGRTMNGPDWKAFARTRFSVEIGGLKMIREAEGAAVLFDLAADPGENDDLALRRPDDLGRLEGMLAAYLVRIPPPKGKDEEEGKAAEEALESLRGLGYIR